MTIQRTMGSSVRVCALTLLALSVFASGRVWAARPYSLIDLGDLPGGRNHTFGYDMNNAGQVVGHSTGTSGTEVIIWDQANGLRRIEGLDGDSVYYHTARGINDVGQVVIDSSYNLDNPLGSRQALLWDANAGIRPIEAPIAGNETVALAINNSGQVAGYSDANPNPGISDITAFYWDENNGAIDLGPLIGGTNNIAFDINNHGVVVGRAEGLRAASKGFMWDQAHGVRILDSLYAGSAESTWALAINDLGQVVGDSYNGVSQHAFLWDESNGIVDLGDLFDGQASSEAVDINAAGQIVGHSSDGDEHRRFLWDPAHGMRDLSTLIDDSGNGWEIIQLFTINDHGWILGVGATPYGRTHAFVLVPEPSTLVLIALSLLAWQKRS